MKTWRKHEIRVTSKRGKIQLMLELKGKMEELNAVERNWGRQDGRKRSKEKEDKKEKWKVAHTL